jgi:uncharacterized membrane protein YqjE
MPRLIQPYTFKEVVVDKREDLVVVFVALGLIPLFSVLAIVNENTVGVIVLLAASFMLCFFGVVWNLSAISAKRKFDEQTDRTNREILSANRETLNAISVLQKYVRDNTADS